MGQMESSNSQRNLLHNYITCHNDLHVACYCFNLYWKLNQTLSLHSETSTSICKVILFPSLITTRPTKTIYGYKEWHQKFCNNKTKMENPIQFSLLQGPHQK